MRLTSPARSRGISLPETLAVLAVVGGLIAVAIPSFRDYIADSDVSSTTNLFIAHLNSARSEAVNRGIPVALCVSEDAATCSGTTNWENGWLVFTDADGAPGVMDGTDEVLRVARDQQNRVQFDTDSSYIRFGSIGQIDPD